MRKTVILVAFILVGVYTAQSQRPEWTIVYSDDFHFIASFPDQPKQSEGDVETGYGKGFSHRWRLELPNISYEVSVTDFPDLSVKMDYKPLDRFYESVCNDLASQYGVSRCGYSGYDQFGEFGRMADFGSNQIHVSFEIWLVHQRLYQAKVVRNASLEKDKEALADVRKFLDEFLFVHMNEKERKLDWGLPRSESQGSKTINGVDPGTCPWMLGEEKAPSNDEAFVFALSPY